MAPTGPASTATTPAAEDAGGSADEANPDNPARGVEAAPPLSPPSDGSISESASGSSMDLDEAGVAPLTDDDNLSDDSQLIFSVVRANHMRNVLAVAVSSKVNQFNRRGFTPLHVAAAAGMESLVDYFLASGGHSVHDVDAEGGTPLLAAAPAVVAPLLRAGADVAGVAGTPAPAAAVSEASALAALPPPPAFDDAAAVDLAAPPPDAVTASVALAARRADVYAAFTDVPRARAWTQRPAVVGGGVGAPWSMEAGPFSVSGTVVEAVPGVALTLTWRSAAWPPEQESRVALTMADEEGKTRLTVAHTQIPPGQRGAVEAWWRGEVFRRIKVVFGWGDASVL